MFSYPVLPNKLGAYRIPLAYQEIYQGKIIFFTIGKLLQSTYVFLKKKKKKTHYYRYNSLPMPGEYLLAHRLMSKEITFQETTSHKNIQISCLLIKIHLIFKITPFWSIFQLVYFYHCM